MSATASGTTQEQVVDLDTASVRSLNAGLHEADGGQWLVVNPGGRHAIAAGAHAPVHAEVAGHAGYYCAGMNRLAEIHVRGNCGVGVAENMMSGRVTVYGDVSQSAGASAHGGVLTIHGNASARCGISMKGADIVVGGSVGHLAAFMAQSGRLVVCGDAGESLGDSIYEAEVFVRGQVAGLGTDCMPQPMDERQRQALAALLAEAGFTGVDASDFRRFGSGRRLYNFEIDDAGLLT